MITTTNKEASDAITSAQCVGWNFIAALKDDMTLKEGEVQGLAAILADLNEALHLPASHLNEFVLVDVHGPGIRRPLPEQAPEVSR